MTENKQAPAVKLGAQNLTKDTSFMEDTQLSDKVIVTKFAELEQDIADNVYTMNNNDLQAGLFRIRPAYKCLLDAQSQPIPRNLFHSLMYEGDITILFADTNVGKSILAVQIANEISKTDKVLYVDLEQSDKQFQGRYSTNYSDLYPFNDNLLRIDFMRHFSSPDGCNYDDYFLQSLRTLVESTGAKIIIIDNMTKLISTDTDKANAAKPLMDKLGELQIEHGLTMLLLEHSRKTDMFSPISLNHLQGSKMKANFADAVFSIGRSSKDPNIRYIKQLKCRSAEIIHDADNVAVYELVKENSFLHFKPIGFSSEYEHLKVPDENTHAERNIDIIELKNKGLSNIEIGKQFGISEGAVRKVLKKSGNIQ